MNEQGSTPDVRPIDANALKDQAVEVDIVTPPHNHYCSELVVFDYDIDEAPTIDAVPVVRCKDCKEYIYPAGVCKYWNRPVSCDGYCYHGAKMDGGAEG